MPTLNNAYIYGKPEACAQFRSTPEDFQVKEVPLITPEGEGEHYYLHIRKTGENTDWVARQLAKFCQVSPGSVGYAGKKDRHAVTEQWFSVHVPGTRLISWSLFETDTIKILSATRHTRKLRLGSLQGNQFSIRLRKVSDGAFFSNRLEKVCQGVPNYFGEQRFGVAGGNLDKGLAMLKGELKERQRHKKGLYLSAVRSWLFNEVVSARINGGLWNQLLLGDLVQQGADTVLTNADNIKQLQRAVEAKEASVTAPLWGRGRSLVTAQAAEWEQGVIDQWQAVCERLEHVGLQQDRRSVALYPRDFVQEQETEDQWLLQFFLPAGAFATSVLRELCMLERPQERSE